MKIWKLGLIGSVMTAALAAATGTAFSEDRLMRGRRADARARGRPRHRRDVLRFPVPALRGGGPGRRPALVSTYPTDMRVVYRHFPIETIHADAGRAAEASICALEQGRFWDMYHSMLANQSELDLSGLIRQAGDIGLDSRTFSTCLQSGRHRADWRSRSDGRRRPWACPGRPRSS